MACQLRAAARRLKRAFENAGCGAREAYPPAPEALHRRILGRDVEPIAGRAAAVIGAAALLVPLLDVRGGRGGHADAGEMTPGYLCSLPACRESAGRMFHREGREISQKAKGAESGRREERACRFLTERASSTSDFCDIGSSGVGIQSDAYVLQKMTLGHEHHNAASSSPPPPLLQERASNACMVHPQG
ncbi:hypothetical protein BHE74_00043678 [Ensete ventricosum]|nr:hypothetical protein BHE74_00043678 [Ensete ventricosum]